MESASGLPRSAATIDIDSPAPDTGKEAETLSTPVDIPRGQSDQACKECRRRKSRCNKAIPICNLCVKYRRHCLYEKYSRTPLTRKHLTEVEDRLERAEVLIRQMSRLLPSHSRFGILFKPPNAATPSGLATEEFDFASADAVAASGTSRIQHDRLAAASVAEVVHDTSSDTPPDAGRPAPTTPWPIAPPPAVQAVSQPTELPGPLSGGAGRGAHGQATQLESPPATEDFDWDEQDTVAVGSPSSSHGRPYDAAGAADTLPSPVLDGMASLALGEQEAGYLGVASGAALLRILEPARGRRDSSHHNSRPQQHAALMPTSLLNPNRHIADSMIDAYFLQYHAGYPILHEPTFRAQWAEVIPRPHGDSWTVLVHVVAALGVFATATVAAPPDTVAVAADADRGNRDLDMVLFAQARSVLSFDFLERGNLTMVQALTLTSNYLQKRDKPNSGYNYLGLAVRMAMGLGLHKEFQGWRISPLNMEIRRRVWWTLCVFDVGATITFSRPMAWPFDGVDVALPMNVHDSHLTAASTAYPAESAEVTPYTAVRTQASFHIAAAPIYARVISKPFPSTEEIVRLERERLDAWRLSVPRFFAEDATDVPPRYLFAHAVMQWRYRNLRIIMYRAMVIRRALAARGARDHGQDAAESAESQWAYDCCLVDARFTIQSVSAFWDAHPRYHNRLTAWYALYFLFQAVLIPCICLRNDPLASYAPDWRAQIVATLRTIAAMASVHPSAMRCHRTIASLCGRYLSPQHEFPEVQEAAQSFGFAEEGASPRSILEGRDGGSEAAQQFFSAPIDESPQTQINSVFPMLWPNAVPVREADLVIADDTWMELLGVETEQLPEPEDILGSIWFPT